MASVTKRIILGPAWVDISEGNRLIIMQAQGAGDVEIFYGATAPGPTDVGVQLLTSQEPQYLPVTGDDGVWARTVSGIQKSMVVYQIEALPALGGGTVDPNGSGQVVVFDDDGDPVDFLPPGRAAAAASVPVVLSTEDNAALGSPTDAAWDGVSASASIISLLKAIALNTDSA